MQLLSTLLVCAFLCLPAEAIRGNKETRAEIEEMIKLGKCESSVCIIFSELGVFTGVLIEKDLVLTVAQPFSNYLPKAAQTETDYSSAGTKKVISGMVVFTDDVEPREVELIRKWIDEDCDFRQICIYLNSLYIDAIPFNTLAIHYGYHSETNESNLALIELEHTPRIAKPIPLCTDHLPTVIQQKHGLDNLLAVGYGYGFGDYLRLQRVASVIDYSPYVTHKQNSWLLHFSPTAPKKFSEEVLNREKIHNHQRNQVIKHTFFPQHNFGRFTPGDQGAPLIYNGQLCGIYSHNTLYACAPSKHNPSSITRFDLFRTSQIVGKTTPLWTRGATSALKLMRAVLHR